VNGGDLFVFRLLIKNAMILDRGGKCHRCKAAQGAEVHEILSRGRTIGNDAARMLSYDKHLCALLCRDCHETAHSPQVADELLQGNIDFYGYEPVETAYNAVQAEMRTRLNIQLPNKRRFSIMDNTTTQVFDPYESRIENEQQELEALRTFYNIMTSQDAHTEVLDALGEDEEYLTVWAELDVTCSELVAYYTAADIA